MKTRKTKKRNIIRRTVAFLLCMTMVLGLGMQDVIEQVYAEGVSAVSQEQSALETQNVESTEAVTPEEETDPTASGDTTGSEESETTTPEETADSAGNTEPTDPANPADADGNTEVTTPPTETTEPTTPADGTTNTDPTDPAAPETPADSNGSEPSGETTPGESTGTDEQKPPVEEDTKEKPVSELTYAAEDGSFSVKAASVSEDVDLSGIEIHASQVQKDGEEADRYAAAEELVAGALDAESRQIEELQTYDIWFTYTENGETADLSGQVQISLEYTAPEFPEGTDAQLEVFCLNGGAAEAVDGTDALAAGCELYALAWAVPAESTDTWEWTDEQVIIKASAEKGVLPEGAEISVTPIVKTEEEELANLSEEERAEAEAINEQYAQTEEKLTEDLKAQATEEAALSAAEADTAAVDAASDSEGTADAATAKTLEGFLAYDICFLVNGEEVEPADGEVNVSIEFNEAVIPEGVSEDAEVSVAHLKEEKDEIVVEDLTTAETTTVETTEKAEVKKVELVTESFSTFTIVWTGSGFIQDLTVTGHYVYWDEGTQKYEEIPDNVYKPQKVEITQERTYDLSGYAVELPGYTYQKTTVNNEEGAEITALEASSESTWAWTTYYIKYVQKNGTISSWLQSGYDQNTSGDIYFLYERDELSIADNIMEEGTLNAVYTGEKNVTGYQWYKSDKQDGEYQLVARKNFQNGASNLYEDVDGLTSGVYPAYDEGARQWYKVEVTFAEGDSQESAPFQVPYYDALQNGSFEEPVVPGSSSNHQYSNEDYKNAGGVWQSTGVAEGVSLEIVHEGRSGGDEAYSWYGDWNDAAPDKVQFAELNCEAAGALYQDVLTMEGNPLNYSLRHRARGTNRTGWPEYDTMYLVIMPTSEAVTNGLTTQENLRNYLNDLSINIDLEYNQIGSEIIYDRDGVRVVRVTSDDQNWQRVRGQGAERYTPESSLTRFFFVAGATASKDNTVGNFLDDVWFTQDIIPVEEDEFTLRIEKKIEGLDSNDFATVKNKLQFTISAKDNKGIELTEEDIIELFGYQTINGSQMTEAPDGSLSFTLSNKKIGPDEQYEVTITESSADMPGYILTPESETIVRIGDTGPVTEAGATIENLQGGMTARVIFTNHYVRSATKNVTFTKIWDDAEDLYNTRPDELNVTLKASITVSDQIIPLDEAKLGLEPNSFDVELNNTNTVDDSRWRYIWENLPVYYTYEGEQVKIDYSIEEGDIGGSYVYESGEVEEGNGDGYEMTVSGDLSRPVTGASTTTNSMTFASEADGNELGMPSHKKYIEYDSESGEYTLNLNVTGAKGEAKGVDILFVIDRSGSMGAGRGEKYNNLLPDVKELLTKDQGIIDQIFAGEGNVNSVAYVSFSDQDGTYTSEWYQKNDAWLLKRDINRLSADGGTNWTYAMQRAGETLAQKANDGNEKVVIFLSDGQPTYTMWGGEEYGKGNATEEWYYTGAINNANSFVAQYGAKIYSVYLTSGTQAGMEKFSDGVTGSQLVNGTNLSGALTEILKQVIPTYKNVVITDKLSEYVVFASSNPAVTVTKETADGQKSTLTGGRDYQLGVDETAGTVTVSFTGELEDRATYTVSFNVVPSEQAKEEFVSRGEYPHEGDAETGDTSANKKGFYSNVYGETKVEYTVNEVPGEANYPMPVVQVPEPTETSIKVQKVWEGDGPQSEIQVALYRSINGGNATKYDSIMLNGEEQPEPWTYIWSDLPLKDIEGNTYTYAVREVDVPDGYTSSILENTDNPEQIVVTITNKYDPYSADEEYHIVNVLQTDTLTVLKNWEDENDKLNLRPDEITVTVNDGKGNSYRFNVEKEDWRGEITVPRIKDADYSVSEDQIPHYTLSGQAVEGPDNTFTITNKLAEKSITVNKVWRDGEIVDEPGAITFMLQYRTSDTDSWKNYQDAPYTISKENNWTTTISGLPATYQYQVVETNVPSGYVYTVTADGDIFTITNTLVWNAKKISRPLNGEVNGSPLEGAEFDLVGNGVVVAKGTSGPDGMIEWKLTENAGELDLYSLDGTYTIKETKAPDGYLINETGWQLTFEDGLLIMVNGEPVTEGTAAEGIIITLENEILYELPSTGGPGIYLYMLGGVALMMAGTLLVYKKRKEEVLRS